MSIRTIIEGRLEETEDFQAIFRELLNDLIENISYYGESSKREAIDYLLSLLTNVEYNEFDYDDCSTLTDKFMHFLYRNNDNDEQMVIEAILSSVVRKILYSFSGDKDKTIRFLYQRLQEGIN